MSIIDNSSASRTGFSASARAGRAAIAAGRRLTEHTIIPALA
jgi:hypothetical protein